MKFFTGHFLILLFLLILATGCNTNNKTDEYTQSINEWHKKRITALTKNTGWLTLAGLYWLKQGENTFGADSSNQIIFPPQAPKFMGSLFLNDSLVSIKIKDGVDVLIDSNEVTEMNLNNDNQKDMQILSSGSLIWYIIKRTDKYGVRLKDTEHPNLKSFKGIERFPVNKKWRVQAHLEPYDSAKTIRIPNVLGQVSDAPCPGALVFEIGGKTYKLDPIAEKTDDEYWLIFADETNNEETYGAGRFLYVDKIDSTGTTFIDFNKAYNPPCVFTPYATCPLPPLQNRLPIRVTAGEKNWGHEKH